MSVFDRLYGRLPVGLQNAAVSAYGVYWRWLRFGGEYARQLAAYRSRERWSGEEWSAFQEVQLRSMLAHAAASVPYYRRTWTEDQKRAARSGQLAGLPLLEKDPIRQTPHDFCASLAPMQRPLVFYTSGSTGTPIAALFSLAELRSSLAVREVRSAGWAGVSFRQPRATISGRLVEPDPGSRGPFHRYNAAERQVYFSAFHLAPHNAAGYVQALWDHRVQWLTGYAVSYFLLARFILEQGLRVPPLKAVITTSEKVTPPMRAVMERAFGCRVYEEYSTVENALFASECEHGRLHVSPDVGLVEILRPDGSDCAPGEVGEVVTTGLMRKLQPLIRYRLGDLAAWDPRPCPCGRAMPVIREVLGRVEDVVVGPDGRQMVRFHGLFVHQPNIQEGQVIQEALDRIRVKVVPTGQFSAADAADVVARVQQRLGPAVQVIVEPVESIPRSKAGKFKAVVSLLEKKHAG